MLLAREHICTDTAREHRDRNRHDEDSYAGVAGAEGPSPVLLFELKPFLQPAVNRQPGYRWGDS